ncbi:uncharacterized protein LOC135828822 [Sycon ciliatum]|uniref:uncharacterized protein LOC135828822 n=1 Tax=Sycon ciliatum TaxID=27933 RepID=UPI0031F68BB3
MGSKWKSAILLRQFVWIFLVMAFIGLSSTTAAAQRTNGQQSGQDSDTSSKVGDWSPSKVHFVSSCHLDVGFANTATAIVNLYFSKYFPSAIKTAEELRQAGGEERLVFLTHTYLVSLYLDCPPNMGLSCPSDAAKQEFTEAVMRGDIVWHAMPFNSELAVLDPSMVDFSIQLTHDLDAKMKRNSTITMSQRDVPGTTRSIIPILKKRGVQAITVGVNGASMPPAVPSVFRWRDAVSNEEVLAMWHPGGYGGQSCCSASDAVVIDGVEDALVFGVRGDNSGPPSADELKRDWAKIKAMFPNATVVASDYDSFVRAVLPQIDKLPVYDQEIGDTWIYGVPSDPWKTAASRAIMAARSACLEQKKCSFDDSEFYNFSRLLVKAGEHTWGLDVKSHLNDYTHWSNEQFHSVQGSAKYLGMVNGWQEQRDWAINYAVDAMHEQHPLRVDIEAALDRIQADMPSLTGYTQVTDVSQVFKVGTVEIGFSKQPAGINHLMTGGVQLASDSNILSAFLYQSFDEQDYQVFMEEYLRIYKKGGWMDLDFGKPGLDNVTGGSSHQEVYASMQSLWMKDSSFVVEVSFPAMLVSNYGAPERAYLNITISPGTGVDIRMTFVNKTATRIPESMSLQFNPVVTNSSTMMMEKVGQQISVLDIMNNGSKHLHAVGTGGMSYTSNPGFTVSSAHVAVVCVGKPTPFPVPMETPSAADGFAFNIVNNIWGTNYIMWYPYKDEDKSFNFDFHINLPHA